MAGSLQGLVGPEQTLYTWRPLIWPCAYLTAQSACLVWRCGLRLPLQVLLNKAMALFLEFLTQQWMLVAALLVVVVMLILHEARKSGPSVTPQQAINMVNTEDGVFLDLRDAAEFNKGHIVGAINIPATKLTGRMAELEKLKDNPIVLVCKMGQQSGAAGKQLKAEKYEQVYKMTGGMMEWDNLQLPTVA